MRRSAEDIARALGGTPTYGALPEPALRGLAGGCRVLELAPREVLLHDGRIPSGAHVLVRGLLTRSLVDAQGRAVLLNRTRPVTAFATACALDGSPHLGVIEAQEASEVVLVPLAPLKRALAENPAFSLAMVQALARSSVHQTRAIRELMFPVPVRLARLLCQVAGEDGRVPADLSRVDMAEMLATVPETLSRALGTLCAAGYVETSGRGGAVRIRDAAALRAYARLG